MGATAVGAITAWLAPTTGGAVLTAGSSALAAGAINAVGGAALAAGASKALAPKMRIPNLPTTSPAQDDKQSEQANQDVLRRQAVAGGVNSTILTGGQGAPLNNTVSSKTLLGA